MALSTKLLVPVALGLSLVTVTAFVVYYVFKREEESQDKPIRSTKVNIIEIQVPKSIVPALIGRNGSNIKNIEEKSGAMIHFKKFSEKDYDVCIIRGRSNATQIAETLIHDFIKQQPVIEEDTLSVPGWACGRIIGTGGENINNISHRSGARVKLEGERVGDLSAPRQIRFRGTADQINTAKKLVEEYVEQERCRREIEQSKRNSRNAVLPPLPVAAPPAQLPGDQAKKHVRGRREPTSASIEVYISAVSSPSRFWVQFVGPQVTQLDDLVTHMTEYYGNKENRANHAIRKLSVGQVVAAVFRHDGRWYRARVDDIRPNEFDATKQVADLYYLDYGDSEYVGTHELCELRGDLLRLRFQAMECFLVDVEPIGASKGKDADGKTPRWSSQAIERFEELVHVARWKPLISRTCAYKKSAATPGDMEREIPGIKLYDVTDEGTIDVAEALIAEGWGEASSATPRSTPPPLTPNTPFGDLSISRVLGMVGPSNVRSSSMPKDHMSDRTTPTDVRDVRRSLGADLDSADKVKSISNFDLSYPSSTMKFVNGSQDFINSERENMDSESDGRPKSPGTNKTPVEEFKANINRIDSHQGSLEALGRQHDVN